jgi:hypothetical protein
MIMEPPVSSPSVATQSRATGAMADPELEPPGTFSMSQALQPKSPWVLPEKREHIV